MRASLIASATAALVFGHGVPALDVAVISDLNGSYGSIDYSREVEAAIAAIIEIGPDLVLVTGDMIAGQRQPPHEADEVRAMWRAFHAAVTDPLTAAGIPVAVTPGNHDASAYPNFEAERAIYGDEWKDRRPDLTFTNARDYPFFYAFDMEGVRFVSLDVTTIGPLSPGQMTALEDAVTSAGPIRIAYSHLPLWEFAQDRETEIIGDPALEEAFGTLGIDIHLSGHHHAFYPGASEGIVYIGQACLGASPRRLVGTDERGPRGFTLLEIDGETGQIEVGFRAAPDFRPGFDMTPLPEQVEGFDRTLVRIDLADLALIHAETTD